MTTTSGFAARSGVAANLLTGRNSPVTSPTKPTKQSPDNLYRVFRGGGWNNSVPSMLRSANRNWGTPANRYFSLGFRCAQRGAKMPVGKVGP